MAVDRPLAVVDAVNTPAPVTYWVHVDQLNRPIRMTDAAKATVWNAKWLPFGGVESITGAAALDARFPGQWFQIESGLHYNWHRTYDPTTGRYTQPDPLGFVDGPGVYGYARSTPAGLIDKDGRLVLWAGPSGTIASPYGGGTIGAGGGIDLTEESNWWDAADAFGFAGAAFGADVSANFSVGLFFGDWCQMMGRGYNVSMSLYLGHFGFNISGGTVGIFGGVGLGLPIGADLSITESRKRRNHKCDCSTN